MPILNPTMTSSQVLACPPARPPARLPARPPACPPARLLACSPICCCVFFAGGHTGPGSVAHPPGQVVACRGEKCMEHSNATLCSSSLACASHLGCWPPTWNVLNIAIFAGQPRGLGGQEGGEGRGRDHNSHHGQPPRGQVRHISFAAITCCSSAGYPDCTVGYCSFIGSPRMRCASHCLLPPLRALLLQQSVPGGGAGHAAARPVEACKLGSSIAHVQPVACPDGRLATHGSTCTQPLALLL